MLRIFALFLVLTVASGAPATEDEAPRTVAATLPAPGPEVMATPTSLTSPKPGNDDDDCTKLLYICRSEDLGQHGVSIYFGKPSEFVKPCHCCEPSTRCRDQTCSELRKKEKEHKK